MFPSLLDAMSGCRSNVVVIGFGEFFRYSAVAEVKSALLAALAPLPRPLSLIYGGDDPSLGTVGTVVRDAAEAIAAAEGKGAVRVLRIVAGHLVDRPDLGPGLDSVTFGYSLVHGAYGGVVDGSLVGASALYFGAAVCEVLTGVICLGGGNVAKQEAQYALARGLPLLFLPCVPLTNNGTLPLEEWWAREVRRPPGVWTVSPQRSSKVTLNAFIAWRLFAAAALACGASSLLQSKS